MYRYALLVMNLGIIDIRSCEVLLDVVFTELVFQLLLEMLLGQLLICILFDQDCLLKVVHYLEDQDQLLLTSQFHAL